jgi:hypothetical protein
MTSRKKSQRTRALHGAARLAHARYALPASTIVNALVEAERALAAGGLASLGNILHQNGAVGLGAAMDLNRAQASR